MISAAWRVAGIGADDARASVGGYGGDGVIVAVRAQV
jgi:hypothetical protein